MGGGGDAKLGVVFVGIAFGFRVEQNRVNWLGPIGFV